MSATTITITTAAATIEVSLWCQQTFNMIVSRFGIQNQIQNEIQNDSQKSPELTMEVVSCAYPSMIVELTIRLTVQLKFKFKWNFNPNLNLNLDLDFNFNFNWTHKFCSRRHLNWWSQCSTRCQNCEEISISEFHRSGGVKLGWDLHLDRFICLKDPHLFSIANCC